MNDLVALSWADLAVGASFILVHAGLSLWLRLGLERRLLVSAVRAVVQLGILGAVLVPVFRSGNPWLVLAIATGMVALASREAVRRVSRRYTGILGTSIASTALAAGATVLLSSLAILRAEPWWDPRYLVPFLGMILGNSLNGISLGLDRCLAELDRGRDEVELLLARGASRWEAARPVAAEAIRTGLVPIVNTMSVVGLVSIPGMMTGQILGGTPPEQAARYQVLILFLIAGAVALGTAGAVLASLARLFDRDHRLRADRLWRAGEASRRAPRAPAR